MIQVLDFYAEWCAPCKVLSPIIDQLAEEYGDRVQFIKADVEEEQDLVLVHSIRNVPTIVIMQDGEQVARHTGSITKVLLKQIIETWI